MDAILPPVKSIITKPNGDAPENWMMVEACIMALGAAADGIGGELGGNCPPAGSVFIRSLVLSSSSLLLLVCFLALQQPPLNLSLLPSERKCLVPAR